MAEDLDIPPASDDAQVQNYLDTKWRESVRGTREAMECLRDVYLELTQHLPETAVRHLRTALHELESASNALHLAGRHVLGQVEYDDFLTAQTTRQIRN